MEIQSFNSYFAVIIFTLDEAFYGMNCNSSEKLIASGQAP